MSLVWPFDVLKPRGTSIDPMHRGVSGGVAFSGVGQDIASDAGVWIASYEQISIRNADQVRAWDALAVMLEGRLNPVTIRVCRPQARPRLAGFASLTAPVPHSDGAFFSDGAGYVSRVYAADVAADAALRATTLQLSKIAAFALEVPNAFSIGEKYYRISKVVAQTATTATVTIWPPLREAVTNGTPLNFDSPVMRARLATANEMRLTLDLNRFAAPTVNFIEDI
jgi:hypothetical protein